MAARHRTNSLAFAKSDCHTCSELKRWCDRQRPQCGTCIKHRRKCGGYVLDLTWKKPSGNSPGRGSVPPSPGLAVQSERQFKFKQGRPKKKRKVQKATDKENSVVDHARTPGPPLSRDEVNVRPLRPRPRREIVEEPDVLLPLREQDAENQGDAWFQAEGSVSEGGLFRILPRAVHRLTTRHQFEVRLQLLKYRIGLPHLPGLQMMRIFGKIHWKQRGALLNSRLGHCSPTAQINSATHSHLTLVMPQTPQARLTVQIRRFSLASSICLRPVTQI